MTDSHLDLIKALDDLFDAFGLTGNLCGVTDQFNVESAVEIINFAARLKRKGGASAPRQETTDDARVAAPPPEESKP